MYLDMTGFHRSPNGQGEFYRVENLTYNSNTRLNYAAFWVSDPDSDFGHYRYIFVKQNDVQFGSGDKESFRASVRCVKD